MAFVVAVVAAAVEEDAAAEKKDVVRRSFSKALFLYTRVNKIKKVFFKLLLGEWTTIFYNATTTTLI